MSDEPWKFFSYTVIGFDLGHDLDWIFKVKFWKSHISGIGGPIYIEWKGVIHDHDRDLFVTKMRCKDLPTRWLPGWL